MRARAAFALAVVLAVTGCVRAPSTGSPEAGIGTVVELVDGDTLEVSIDGRRELVRLIGIDTPETVHPTKPTQCWGEEASALLASLVPVGTEVRLVRDSVARDRYGRLLAYVHRAADDALVNLAMVEQGAADAVSYGDNEALHGTFVAAEAAARDAGRGLWGACSGPDQDIGPPPPGGG